MVRIAMNANKLTMQSPFHPDLPEKARALGGKFAQTEKVWVFDPRDEERVRELAREIYGTDGETVVKTVAVRLHLDQFAFDEDKIWFGGRRVAVRMYRDSAVQLGEGVIILAGGFPRSGGSARYPMLNPETGTVLEVRDVPESLVKEEDGVEIVADQTPPNLAAAKVQDLLQKRDRLLAELDLIDDMVKMLSEKAMS
ncbi:hypothetical protein CEB3_c13480 [Peptococcaceae bacterium CEB3]|nr:hypothetical protein CEB3_c13480 [Peptococcaceae bacterium CEB3]